MASLKWCPCSSSEETRVKSIPIGRHAKLLIVKLVPVRYILAIKICRFEYHLL